MGSAANLGARPEAAGLRVHQQGLVRNVQGVLRLVRGENDAQLPALAQAVQDAEHDVLVVQIERGGGDGGEPVRSPQGRLEFSPAA